MQFKISQHPIILIGQFFRKASLQKRGYYVDGVVPAQFVISVCMYAICDVVNCDKLMKYDFKEYSKLRVLAADEEFCNSLRNAPKNFQTFVVV